MRSIVAATCLACLLALAVPTSTAAQGLPAPQPIGPYLNGAFPESSPGSDPNAAWALENYYPGLTFVEPLRIIEHPTQNWLIIVGKDGLGWRVTHDAGSTDKILFFDLSNHIQGKSGTGEGGISDLVFHPQFGQSGSAHENELFITYRWAPTPGFDSNPTVDGYDRMSRFQVVGDEVDLLTEEVLIQQFDREQWHIGGDMFFGDDGYLYISRGDEGNCCSRLISTQRLDLGLFSGILRIDVDNDPNRSHPIPRQPLNPDPPPVGWPDSMTQGYSIPDDNPWLDPGGSILEEFYAIGLRHPWTISRDATTGQIWAADVGQGSREEINLVFKADNLQWGYMEGTIAGVIPTPQTIIGNEAPPVWEYDHTVGKAVIGAGVYRGEQFPELFGKYLFSDFTDGQLWTAEVLGQTVDIQQIGSVTAGFGNGINSYLLDSKDDVLLAKTLGGLNPGGTIQRLIRQSGGGLAPEPPGLLSETGAFQNLQTLDPVSGCIPYTMIVPFWSDGALKSRWICIPNDGTHDAPEEQVGFSAEGDWILPEGAVLIKHFEILLDETDPLSAKRLETRFLVHGTGGYYGVTYRWLPGGSDAALLTTGEDENLTIDTPSGSKQQTWHYPKRSECLTCHNSTAGGALGPLTRQLNTDLTYPSTQITANQLETWNSLGIFAPPIDPLEIPLYRTSRHGDDLGSSLAARARSYLDSNCGYCHMPGGVRANFDARLTTPLADQNLVNGSLVESLGIAGEAVIAPGDLTRSILYHRANSAGLSFSMPPLAKDRIDDPGMALLADWIDELGGFSLGNETATDGAFIDGHHPSLYINETDTFVVDDETTTLHVQEFSFHARRIGNPVTPIVVRVNGDNDFTVLAIGTTRTSADYVVGENVLPFDDAGAFVLPLGAGTVIATGFLDSFPDGSGWGGGTVVPAESGSGAGQDEIWALLPSPLITQDSGFVPGVDTSAVAIGESPLVTNAGKSLQALTGLRRSYKFAIGFGYAVSGSGGQNAPQLTNRSFEAPMVVSSQIYSSDEIPGWTITTGDVELVRSLWTAADAQQSLDLNGSAPGSIEQTLSGFTPGATYELSLKYAQHIDAITEQMADVVIDGVFAGSLTTSVDLLAPNFQLGAFSFVAPTDGTVAFEFHGMSSGQTGVVIDDVRLSLVAPPGPSGLPGPFDLGNPADQNLPSQDLWESNMVINETDLFTHAGPGQLSLRLDSFNFFAAQAADPVTPFVVAVHGDNDFTTLAVGTTRTTYAPGANSVAFADGSAPVLLIPPGTTIATGFLDAQADGSGGGLGAVIPYASGGDEIWYTGGPADDGTDSGSVVVGSAPIPGTNVSDQTRDYAFSISITPIVGPCDTTTNVALTGQASQSSNYNGTQFPAALAINGSLGDHTHTETGQANPSWEVLLAEDVDIRNVVLHNRQSCCSSRLRDITVTLLDSGGAAVWQSALLNPENVLGSPATIEIDFGALGFGSLRGRTLRVSRTSDPDLSGGGGNADEADVLSLAEVEVFACAGLPPVPGAVTGLVIDKSSTTVGDITLGWTSSCGVAEDYGIFEGTIGNWYDHTQIDCSDDDADLIEDVQPGVGSHYYLVVPLGGGTEGSYGFDDQMSDRPAGLTTCRAGRESGGCPAPSS